MPAYRYSGRNDRMEPVSGTIEADSTSAVVQQLNALRITVTDIQERAVRNTEHIASGWWTRMSQPRITDNDVILFSRQMHTMQKAGVPILRALAGLQESAINSSFAKMLSDIRHSLDQGRELSASMIRHPNVFTPFYIAMIRVGEVSGQLSEVFLRLFMHLEFEKDVREQIKAALRYPLFVVIAVAVAMVILNIFVIPVFAKVFAGFNAQLPLMTRILVGTSDFFVHWWLLIGVVILGGVMGARTFIATQHGRYLWDKAKLRLPIAGDIILKATLSRFARSFSLASQSGIPVLQALTVVSRTVDNAYIARHIEDMRDGIERGESLLRRAAATGVFTPVVLQMIAVGEETGEIDSLLLEIAGMYERETAYAIKGLSAKIEPILLTLLAGVVLVLALGIFLPMWSLSSVASGRGG